jgi:hypothetical protein
MNNICANCGLPIKKSYTVDTYGAGWLHNSDSYGYTTCLYANGAQNYKKTGEDNSMYFNENKIAYMASPLSYAVVKESTNNEFIHRYYKPDSKPAKSNVDLDLLPPQERKKYLDK